MSDIVIKVDNLSKEYRLGVIGHGTLYRDMQSGWARLRGREDPNAIVFEKERKHGDRFMALQNVSFEVKAGERLGIIGKNGAGKSTLLKILSRVTAPSSGSVRLKGRVASLLEVGTGFHPELTGRENVYLNGAILGMSKIEVNKRFDEIVDFSGVEEYIDTPVKRYSSGMRVRLGFAVAAHLEPDIMIVDEVLAVGDAAFQKKCIGKMQDVSNNQGRTILFVSHNMDSVKKLCESGLLIDNGKIVVRDDITSIVDAYININEKNDLSTQLSKIGQPIQIENLDISTFQDSLKSKGLRPRNSLSVKITLNSDITVVNPVVKLHILYKNNLIFGVNTIIDGVSIPIKKGRSSFSCSFQSLPLRPQEYQVLLVVREPISGELVFGPCIVGNINLPGEDGDYGLSATVLRGEGSYAPIIPHVWKFGNDEHAVFM